MRLDKDKRFKIKNYYIIVMGAFSEVLKLIADVVLPGGLLLAFVTGFIPGFASLVYDLSSIPINFYYSLIPLGIAFITDVSVVKQSLPLTKYMEVILYFGLGLAAGYLAANSFFTGLLIGGYLLILHLTLYR